MTWFGGYHFVPLMGLRNCFPSTHAPIYVNKPDYMLGPVPLRGVVQWRPITELKGVS